MIVVTSYDERNRDDKQHKPGHACAELLYMFVFLARYFLMSIQHDEDDAEYES